MMTYKAIAQAMERVAKHVAEKVQKGEQVESVHILYFGCDFIEFRIYLFEL